MKYLHLGLQIIDAPYVACFTLLVSDQSYTYPLWKTPTIACTNPDASSSFAGKEDFAFFSVIVPSASKTSQPKTPAGSDVSNGLFPVRASSPTILSIWDLLRTQKQSSLRRDPQNSGSNTMKNVMKYCLHRDAEMYHSLYYQVTKATVNWSKQSVLGKH